MPSYKFTSDFGEVFSTLTHSPETVVTRKEPVEDVPGSTVVLWPGDVLTVAEPIEQAHLELVPDGSKSSVSTPTKVPDVTTVTPPVAPDVAPIVPAEIPADPIVKE